MCGLILLWASFVPKVDSRAQHLQHFSVDGIWCMIFEYFIDMDVLLSKLSDIVETHCRSSQDQINPNHSNIPISCRMWCTCPAYQQKIWLLILHTHYHTLGMNCVVRRYALYIRNAFGLVSFWFSWVWHIFTQIQTVDCAISNFGQLYLLVWRLVFKKYFEIPFLTRCSSIVKNDRLQSEAIHVELIL